MENLNKDFLLKEVTMSRICEFLNEKFKVKKSFKSFNTTDVQGYIRRGFLPSYLGGNKIVASNRDSGAKLYNILK